MLSRIAFLVSLLLVLASVPQEAAARPDRPLANHCEDLIEARIAILGLMQKRLDRLEERGNLVRKVRLQRLIWALSAPTDRWSRGCSQFVVFPRNPISPS